MSYLACQAKDAIRQAQALFCARPFSLSSAEREAPKVCPAVVLVWRAAADEICVFFPKEETRRRVSESGEGPWFRQWARVTSEVFFWTNENVQPSSPHQELIPWVGWLRGITANNHYWLNYWPELEI